MLITLKNLGAIREAEMSLGDLTVICGENNTGKTYATYALYGFLSYWNETSGVEIPLDDVMSLLRDGSIEIKLDDYSGKRQEYVDASCRRYTKMLHKIFASSEEHFSESSFSIKLISDAAPMSERLERSIGAAKTQLFSIFKDSESNCLTVSLLIGRDSVKIPPNLIQQAIGDAVKDVLFGNVFPRPFIASAERTGAAIFRKELNFARNRMIEKMADSRQDVNPFELLDSAYSSYALPVKDNVDFTRGLEEHAKERSFIEREFPYVLDRFANMIGGQYRVTRRDGIYYVPQGKSIKLSMDESSSAVRSLLDIGFYLRHIAKPGDLLMVDEPELNLHPENQRRAARLFACLANIGLKVFITTHSDYIVKEFNTLIMMNKKEDSRVQEIAKREGYSENELLNPLKVKVYIAGEAAIKRDGNQRKSWCNTLTEARIDSQSGIEAPSFDHTIESMNRIQEEIIWGD